MSRIAARLEDGYDTVVSERGASLSGGEKQCIGIARAMLKDAPIVILDEPTSAMDAHTETMVMEGLERLLRGRTGFIIAHRLSTVMTADAVFVLDGGRVVESGEPAKLLEDPSTRFAALARAQLVPQAYGAPVLASDAPSAVEDSGGVGVPGLEHRAPSLRSLSARWHGWRNGTATGGTQAG